MAIKGKKAFVEGMGCALSQADAKGLAEALRSTGMTVVDKSEDADVIIINGCAVREASDRKLSSSIRRLRNAGKEVIVTGCSAEVYPSVGLSAGASVIPLRDRRQFLGSLGCDLRGELGDLLPPPPGGPIYTLPIGTGCGGNCSFCATKLARGAIASYPPKTLLRLVKEAVERGAVEVDITAVEINSWGRDLGMSFPELLAMMADLPGDFRVRVGMINPRGLLVWIDDLLDAYRSSKVFKFFHVPVQSFSDSVLKNMRRGYTSDEVFEIFRKIKSAFPEASVHTDIIVGFPGETDDDFSLTVSALKRVKFDKVNVARYSPRPLTDAAAWEQVPDPIKKVRSDLLSALWKEEALAINRRYVGREVEALVVQGGDAPTARTQNYKQVVLRQPAFPGERLKVKVVEATPIDLRSF
ncbi:tRNA (N(6)-L-threonylcarbamoyladenosine(37)-C(2))-methylthiotransferase [Tardisphaera saccharovorans]